jgi:hypothetical protein
MTDIDEDAHRHSVSYLFPLIGEPGTTQEILGLLKAWSTSATAG